MNPECKITQCAVNFTSTDTKDSCLTHTKIAQHLLIPLFHAFLNA